MTQFEYPVDNQLAECQQGSHMIRLDQANTDHENREYDNANIVAAIQTFVEAGGKTVEAPGSKYAATTVCLMDEKPSFLSTYPYIDKAAQPTESLLIIVDATLGLDPRVVARQLKPDNLKSKAVLFPELGVVLAEDGLSKSLKLDGSLADLVHEALAIPHFELETSQQGILGRIRRSRVSDKIREMIRRRASQASAPGPKHVSPDPVLTVYRSHDRQESMSGKVRAGRLIDIAESWFKLDPEEQESLLTDWMERAQALKDLQVISRLNYIKRVTAKLNTESIAPHKQYRLKVLLGENLSCFSAAEETTAVAA